MNLLLDAQGTEWISMQVSTYQTNLVFSFALGVITSVLVVVVFKAAKELFS